jgi:hypothetical protein
VKWWQDAFATPVVNDSHPLISGGSFGGENGVLFLTGVSGKHNLDLTISANTALFFPIVNVECSFFEGPPWHGDDEASMRSCANTILNGNTDIFAKIDGVNVDVTPHRFESPLFQWGPLPETNIFGGPAGTTSDAVDAGYYLLLEPLGVGNHVIHFGATYPPLPPAVLEGGVYDMTYNVTVVPEPASLTMLAAAALAGLVTYRRTEKKGSDMPRNRLYQSRNDVLKLMFFGEGISCVTIPTVNQQQ